MQTPRLADRPPKFIKASSNQFWHRYSMFWFVIHVFAIISLIVGDYVPKRGVVKEASLLDGFVHGYYVFPDYLASLNSDKLTFYQVGGGTGYDTGFLIGMFFMYLSISVVFKYRRPNSFN